MALDLVNYELKANEAIKAFWGNREVARQKQIESGRVDQGERGSVTAGKNMDGFVALMKDLVIANGLPESSIQVKRAVLTLPGYFRPTKVWDLLVVHRDELVAAMEFKSHIGPSFGNNFNNRTEEALGTAVDFWRAFREGGFGDSPAPFVGWMMLVEDAPGSSRPVKDKSPHFKIFPEFKEASYGTRYSLLCRKLMQEKLYSGTCLMFSPRNGKMTGEYTEPDPMTGLRTFATAFAGHVAAAAAR